MCVRIGLLERDIEAIQNWFCFGLSQRLQTELALNADVVVGVGPRITEALEYQLSGYPDKRPSLLRMDPGSSPLEDSYQKSSGTL